MVESGENKLITFSDAIKLVTLWYLIRIREIKKVIKC